MLMSLELNTAQRLDRRFLAEVVRRYLPLVRRLARRYHHRTGVELEDLTQVGCLGLLRAIQRFNPEMGRLFEAYANAIIAGEILHYLRDSACLVRPPRDLVELRPAVKSATQRLKQEAQRDPSCDEIAEATGLCPIKVAEIIALDRHSVPVSLDAEQEGEGDGQPMKVQLSDCRYGDNQAVAEDRIMLGQALERLKPHAREVIQLSFYEDLSQQEIGRRLGISQTQVSRRLRMAMRDLGALLGNGAERS